MLEFNVSEKFYGKKGITEKKLIGLLKKFDNANLVGKKSVGIAAKEKLISQKNIFMVSGIPHAQIFRLG